MKFDFTLIEKGDLIINYLIEKPVLNQSLNKTESYINSAIDTVPMWEIFAYRLNACLLHTQKLVLRGFGFNWQNLVLRGFGFNWQKLVLRGFGLDLFLCISQIWMRHNDGWF